MTVLLIAAVPLGAAAVLALALWLGRLVDRAANAAAGFATHDAPPYAPLPDDAPGATLSRALGHPAYLHDHPTREES